MNIVLWKHSIGRTMSLSSDIMYISGALCSTQFGKGLDHAKINGHPKLHLSFTATRYLPPYTTHVGPLDPVIIKEATLFQLYTGRLDPRVA